jgi:RND family efflux transporter MFP subunit
MQAKRIRSVLLIAITAGTIAGCSSGGKRQAEAGPVITGVQTQTVRLESAPQLYEATGTIRSAQTSVLVAQMGGTVREIRVEAGQRVKRGQLLAVLDDRGPQAQVHAAEAGVTEAVEGLAEVGHALEAARADRQFAEATYNRYKVLLAANSLSRQEFDGAEARYRAALASERALESKQKQVAARQQQAHSQQDSAESTLSYSRLVSPLDGIVTAKSVDAGTVVMPGTPVITVEDPSRYRLEASLPAEYLTHARVGATVAVATDHGEFQGRVAEVVPVADAASRTFLVKIDLPRESNCRSGEYGRAEFPVGDTTRLAVPRAAVIEHGELQGIFVVGADGKLEYRLIKTGKTFGDRVEIVSGLSAGEKVAISPIDKLRDGARVEGL